MRVSGGAPFYLAIQGSKLLHLYPKMLPSQLVNPRVIAESLQVVYPLKYLIQEAAPITSCLASWARPGPTAHLPTRKCGLVYLCAQEEHELTTSTTFGNLHSGNRRGDRNPLFFRKHRVLVPLPMYLTSIFEQLFAALHCVTNETRHLSSHS